MYAYYYHCVPLHYRSLLLALPGSIFYQCLVCILGLVMYAYYSHCDPLHYRSLLLALPGSIFYQCLVCILGLVMYAYYHECDPLLEEKITKRDQVSCIFRGLAPRL